MIMNRVWAVCYFLTFIARRAVVAAVAQIEANVGQAPNESVILKLITKIIQTN